jgi:rhodanese-related sulfurtransferase
VRETNVDEVKARLDQGEKLILVDVREESEFAKDHLPGAIHLSKGVIERDIEEKVPDLNAPHCPLLRWGVIARRLPPTACRKWATSTCSRWMAAFVSGGKRDFLSLSNLRQSGHLVRTLWGFMPISVLTKVEFSGV